MSRLHLIIFLFFGSCVNAISQTEVGKYMEYAEEQYQKGDFVYALDYYKKALAIDSNSVAINWGYAETLRAYKDYRNAEKYYKIVYDKEGTLIYPSSLLQLGLMQKQNGKYDEAIESFKLAKKKYARHKKDYLYLKSRREIESCLWAKSAIENKSKKIEPIAYEVNTKDAEFGHIIKDSFFIFSSLKADSISFNEEVYDKNYRTRLYRKDLREGNKNEPELIKDLYVEKMSNGNGTFSLDGLRFYYSLCDEANHNYQCKIMVANYSNGKWTYSDSLGSIINEYGSNTTMPCIVEWNKEEYLVFASDRDGTEGGLDLWSSQIRNGNQFGRVRNLKNLNSPDNETTPYWHETTKTLYFSSSWFDGFGGLDVYASKFDTKLQDPINLGTPINSPANDLYYFRSFQDEYVTSNRLGVQYSKNPTCCSDIFVVNNLQLLAPPTPTETLEALMKRLPVTLYFHNDIPNPKSISITTDVNYLTSYNDYRAMLDRYQKEYSAGLSGEKSDEAKEDIESFFIEYVDQGVKDLNIFRDLLLEELKKGRNINLTVKGFASPLAKTDYNVNLAKRRIGSLVNHLSEYQNGIFMPYIKDYAENRAQLTFTEVPFGEYIANQSVSDNYNDQKNSVYSRAAAMERKIEIQRVNYFNDSLIDLPLKVNSNVIDLGKISSKTKVKATYTLTNTNSHIIHFLPARIPCGCSSIEFEKNALQAGESTNVTVTFDPKEYLGSVVKSVYIKTVHSEDEIRLILTAIVEN
jgi:tetratricopeptide (TPR) repeat protein